ncbi:MAG: phosphohistidine phosphatase SixA [Thermodesulfobacteriota bacterium]
MFLYLVQHAEAKRKDEDLERDLTEKGRRDVEKLAKFVAQLDLPVGQIWHSGKTRALSTGKILANSLNPPQGFKEAKGLAPLDDPEGWADRFSAMDENIMLVGHLPHLARLAALLLTGDQEKNVIDFKMGGMVCLRRGPEARWTVAWMIIPEIIF